MSFSSDFLKTDVARSFQAWELIDSYEDKDGSTIFDYDSGTVTIHNIYKVLLQLEQTGGVGSSTIYVRLNADDSANYNWQELNGGAASSTTGATEFDIESAADHPLLGTLLVMGGNRAVEATTSAPKLVASLANHQNGTGCLSGNLSIDYPDVDEIRIWTSANAGGRLKLYGLYL